MKASLRSGALPHSVRWAVLAALLLLSFGATARDGHGGGGHDGRSHAGPGHDGDRHAGGRHGGRSHRGDRVFLGLGFFPSWYEPYGYGYGYPLSGGIYAPPVYVEQGDEAQSAYWYYCAGSSGYYPYVQQCPEGWLRVVPGPASQ